MIKSLPQRHFLFGTLTISSLFLLIFPHLASAQTDPTTAPLIQLSDLVYQGAFRIPGNTSNDFTYANDGLAHYVTNDSLFMKCKGASFNDTSQQKVTEVNIPALVNSSNINSLNTTTIRQNCADITENHLNPQNITNGMVIGGLTAYNNKFIK